MLDRQFWKSARVPIARLFIVAVVLYSFIWQRIEIPPLTSALSLAGIGLAVLGTLIRGLAAGYLHKNRELATDGVYALARHPLYLGSSLIALGLMLVIRDPLVAGALVVIMVITYLPTIASEEAKMAHRFPEAWPGYRDSTPRILPRVDRIGRLARGGWNAAQWRHNAEYNAPLAVIGVLVALQLYRLFV